MRLMVLVVLALALAGCGKGPADCSYDHDSMMQLDYRSFDQDTPWGGWRGVGRDADCALVAADLIAAWRQKHRQESTPAQASMLRWHEGQMRATAGAYEAAAPLFESAKHEAPEDRFDEAWNLYADASVAFVERDRKALEAAYEALLALEEPADWEQFASESEEILGRRPEWPNNITVVERLRSCFDRPYVEAYANDCDG